MRYVLSFAVVAVAVDDYESMYYLLHQQEIPFDFCLIRNYNNTLLVIVGR